MMTRGGEGGKKCRKFDDVICERPLIGISYMEQLILIIGQRKYFNLKNIPPNFNSKINWKPLIMNSGQLPIRLGYLLPFLEIHCSWANIAKSN